MQQWHLKQQRKLYDSTQLVRNGSRVDEGKAVEQRMEYTIAYGEHWSMYKHGGTTTPIVGVSHCLRLLSCVRVNGFTICLVHFLPTGTSRSTCSHVVISLSIRCCSHFCHIKNVHSHSSSFQGSFNPRTESKANNKNPNSRLHRRKSPHRDFHFIQWNKQVPIISSQSQIITWLFCSRLGLASVLDSGIAKR